MKNLFKVLPVFAMILALSTPAFAGEHPFAEAVGEGCAGLAIPTAVFVGGVALATRHVENGVDARVAALSIGAACAAGATIGGYASALSGDLDTPTQQELQAPEAPADEQSE